MIFGVFLKRFSFSFSLCSVCYFVVRKFFQGTTFTQFSVRAAECEQSKKGSDNFHDLLSFSTCFFIILRSQYTIYLIALRSEQQQHKYSENMP